MPKMIRAPVSATPACALAVYSHARAVRGLANRFLALIFALLTHNQLYDPSRRIPLDPAPSC